MFSTLLLQRLRDDKTIGPRDLKDCPRASRFWTSEGWRENVPKEHECVELRNQKAFEDRLQAGLAAHPPLV
jgi:hypothetical protein